MIFLQVPSVLCRNRLVQVGKTVVRTLAISATMKRASTDVASKELMDIVPKKGKMGHWSQGLYEAMKDPKQIVEEHGDVVVIKDGYPKAQHHYLALPTEVIQNLTKLTPEHLPLLKKMEKIGKGIASKHPSFEFKLGYHGVPSMHQVHMHIISQDFVSDSLKTKKHYNSFATEYFRQSKDVIEELEKMGKVKLLDPTMEKHYLNMLLRCNQCSFEAKNMPTLKKHLAGHLERKKKAGEVN